MKSVHTLAETVTRHFRREWRRAAFRLQQGAYKIPESSATVACRHVLHMREQGPDGNGAKLRWFARQVVWQNPAAQRQARRVALRHCQVNYSLFYIAFIKLRTRACVFMPFI